jgi:DNA repair protein RadC
MGLLIHKFRRYFSTRTLAIKLLDHLIITMNGYYSFADEGLL